MYVIGAIFIALTARAFTSAQDANCDFYQYAQANQTYYMSSPNYPYSYTPGAQCRWIAVCPPGYNCRLDCSEINLPQTTNCAMDRLLVSKTGDPQLSGAEQYCGYGSLTAVSTGQRISVGLITSVSSSGGRFECQLSSQPAATTPSNCRCGYKKSSRIVGGEETGVNEFPMMVGLVHANIFQIKCGGVIIAPRYVLTAAHCLFNQTVRNIGVVVGEHDVTTGDSTATQVILASSFIIHPRYSASSSSYDYDIAIVVLQQDLVFSESVGPACLPFKFVNNNLAGASVTMLGWGTQFFGGPTSNVLQKVDVEVLSPSQCSAATANQMCTYTPGKDACQDDSGGPVLYTDPATGLLFEVGIISYGRSCASGSPGINTRVTEFLQWIQDNTQADYCVK